MAKQKDHGDLLEIHFDPKRDTEKKFVKLIRNVIKTEKRNILLDMTYSPKISSDFLDSFVFGAKALKTHGYTIEFIVAPENFKILKNSPHSNLFKIDIAQIISDEDIEEERESQKQRSLSENNVIKFTDENVDDISSSLSELVCDIQKNGHDKVILDLTEVFFITPELIQTLILESLNSPGALQINILESVRDAIDENPQAAILNINFIKDDEDESEGKDEPVFVGEPISNEKTMEVGDSFQIDFDMEEDIVRPEEAELEVEEKDIIDDSFDRKDTYNDKYDDRGKYDDSPSNFSIEVNCLKAGQMTEAAFLRDFDKYLKDLYRCGEQLFIDISVYGRLEPKIAKALYITNFNAVINNQYINIKLQKHQKEALDNYLPKLEEVDIYKEDTSPKFSIFGSKMELSNVDSKTFMDKFSEHFRKLMATGHKNLVLDICKLKILPKEGIELMVLSYLEAVGRGMGVTIRICPEMEEQFVKSGRGRSLPLEVVKPEMLAKSTYYDQKKKKKTIDIDKLVKDYEEDKLSDKVKNKEYESLHVESRGSFQNWEPIPVTKEEKVYTGTERRKEKRYNAESLEVSYARGTIGKIMGRRYSMKNLGFLGACFIIPSSLTKGETVRLKIFASKELSIEVQGKVIWCRPVPSQALFQIGLAFTKVSEVAKAQLQETIHKLYRKGN